MPTLLLGCLGASTLAFILYVGKKSHILLARMHHYELDDVSSYNNNRSVIMARITLYSISLILLYGFTCYVDINSFYATVGFLVCSATFFSSKYFSTMLIHNHYQDTVNTKNIALALDLSITIPCTFVVVALSLFSTSPCILASAFAMIVICIDYMLIFFAT